MKKGFQERKEELRDILRKAEKLIELKSFKRAVEELERVKFRDVDYYLLLAQAYEGLGNHEKAESYLEEARFLDTELRSRELLQRGITLASMRNFKAAEKELLESLKLNPFEKETYLELYRLYRETNNHKKMVKTLEELITLEPYMAFPYLELAKHYLLRRRFSKAADVLREASERIESPEIHYELGKVYAEWGKTEEAKEELRKACRLDFKNVEYRQKLAEVLVSEEEYEEALDVVLGTLELYPEAVYVLQSAGALYDMLGNEELAEYYYRKAVSVSEGFMKEDAQKLLAEFFVEKGRYDQAEEILWDLLKNTDNFWVLMDAFSELAVILIEQERYSDIVRAGKEVLENPEISDEEFGEVGEIVADALFEEGKVEEALDFYNQVLEVSTDQKLIKRVKEKVDEIKEIKELEKLL
ncbi:tetratricopeptide repeat protein [Thermovibrio guaymasensis]|uniref:Tetratricopeptide repeat protein n=1 Tax=Thermovibrio guaymasensis TaxID=240167 RepID=A0A420W6R7_9BACT|nr:tetratricopeptide repeat protein [Thermovibrio guaymasensis]RKQ61744.1 tetratricopeptide repeat protein [Thermovibrio guaymasensis]